MRKLALLLGSLLVVASASAKEVVPAPVVVEEAPVQVIEKEVIVYRDKEEGFRPNGYVDLQYRYYGDTEGQNGSEKETWHSNGNDDGNNYSRTQLEGKINMTEVQSLYFRIRNFNNLNDSESGKGTTNGTQTRLRYFYNHGNLGDSKVNLTSRIHYQDDVDNTQHIQYQARFNFAEYMFNNDFIKTSYFTVSPGYKYTWGDNNVNYSNRVSVDLESMFEFPLGFSLEWNLYNTQYFYGDGAEKNKNDKAFEVDMDLILYNTTKLYENGNMTLSFTFEGGYDDWYHANEDIYVNSEKKYEDSKYQVYANPMLRVDYQATSNVKVYAAAGAEYRNWAFTTESEASKWRWQPTVVAGFKTTF